jgi:ABC-type amino acid transport substrate-binding protein
MIGASQYGSFGGTARRMVALALVTGVACWLAASKPAQAQAQSGIPGRIAAAGKVRVCIWPEYYGISLRDPRTQQIVGVDADLALELGRDLGVTVEFVDSSFARLIADVTSNRCEVAMFAIGVTEARAEKLRFTRPTLESDIYAIAARGNRRVASWADIDRQGTVVAVIKGTYHEPVMRARLGAATLLVLDTPMAREQAVESGRADVFMTDYPYSRRFLETADWARLIAPTRTFHMTRYAYAVAPGDDAWFSRMERFVSDIKRDGRLHKAAARYKLEAMVVRD